jgi:predicted RNase H-like nuclease (RuvC/YqgF family)
MPYPTPESIATWAGACVAFVGTALALWKRKSKTELDVKKDKVEGNGLEDVFRRLTEQNAAISKDRDMYRQEAHAALELRVSDRELIARLKSENESLQRQITEFTTRIAMMETRVARLNRIIRATLSPEDQKRLETDYGDLF